MEEMTSYQLYELLSIAKTSIDIQFQTWISITFATVVAAFSARNILSKKMRFMITTLYFLASFMLLSRGYYEVLEGSVLLDALAQRGIIMDAPIATMISRIALVFFGSVATTYVIHFGNKLDTDTRNDHL